ncbi:GEVED domain-containing protein [Parerythrobacter aurantius]|uniref:GEVED domain-containing protein n=1 Tax=Parerythrobacter aurantius TaxID=3127706 RepID=UPI0032521F64
MPDFFLNLGKYDALICRRALLRRDIKIVSANPAPPHIAGCAFHWFRNAALSKRILAMLCAIFAIVLANSPAFGQSTPPATVNGAFPVATLNQGGSANGTQNTATLTGLGLNQGVTFDVTGQITNAPSAFNAAWRSGVWFPTSTQIGFQTQSTIVPDGDSGTYTINFSKTVYGLTFRMEDVNFYDSFVINAYDAAGNIVPLTVAANISAFGTELAVTQQGQGIYVTETDGTSTAGQIYVDFRAPLSLGIKRVVFSRVGKSLVGYNANTTLYLTTFAWDVQKDYSDVPASFGDATHRLVSGILLGPSIDIETATQASANANGDDLSGSDDEDGVSSLPALSIGRSTYTIPSANIAATGTGRLHAWIDFNRDGAFQATEYASVNVAAGVLSGDLVFNGLPAMTTGATYARFRFTSDPAITSATPSGVAVDGEVEDYPLQILPSADLSVTKTNAVTSVNAGSVTTYTVTVTNDGPSTVTGAILTDAPATGLAKTAIACSATPGQCSAGSTPTIVQLESGYALPALASGQTYQITIAANVTATSGSVANSAAVAAPSGTVDPTSANNAVSDTDTVTPVVDLVITKTNGGTTLVSGSTTTYTVTVTNNGPSSTTGAIVQDNPVSGLTCLATDPVTITGSGVPAGSFAISDLTGAGIALGTLANGQTATLTYSCKVN